MFHLLCYCMYLLRSNKQNNLVIDYFKGEIRRNELSYLLLSNIYSDLNL